MVSPRRAWSPYLGIVMRRSNLVPKSPSLFWKRRGRQRCHGLLMKKREVSLVFAIIIISTLLYYFLPRLPIDLIGTNHIRPTVEPRLNRTVVPAPTPKPSHEPPTKPSLEFPTKLSCRNRTWCEAQRVCLNQNTIFLFMEMIIQPQQSKVEMVSSSSISSLPPIDVSTSSAR